MKKFTEKSKFTLTELLVVIAIIGILASLLLPVLSKARKQAHAMTCLNNIKTVGLGMQMFRDDEKGIIAHNYARDRWNIMDWALGVRDYLGGTAAADLNEWNFRRSAAASFYGCPTTLELDGNNNGTNESVYSIHYGIPVRPGQISSFVGYEINVIEKPSESILLADGYREDSPVYRGRSGFKQQHAYEAVTGLADNKFKHVDTKASYLFFDGHTELIRWRTEGAFRELYMYDLYNLPDIGLNAGSVTYTP
ncbi:type II secretion system protein [Lentisphaera profundi]|uniref:Type II secretion system protein n=1 Tax=Lentisphaera profundi TaxID=1658616 RepID=A0ABY7VW52_9BACT|nr:type II secretion system protein [Lentisphaera profundi]WDE98466.1 type II secretion system protein [Lentisphaera profundi]